MKPTQEQVIAWAREAGMMNVELSDALEKMYVAQLQRGFILAYEAGQESMKWDGIHSCHPDCQRPACVHTRKAYQEGYEAGRKDENDACAEVCEEIAQLYSTDIFPEDGTSIDCNSAKMGRVVTRNCAQSIRARREQ